MPDLNPEIPHTVPTRIARAVLVRLRNWPVLAAYMAGGWDDTEIEDVFLSSDYRPPCGFVVIEAEEEARDGGSQQAKLRTLTRIALVQSLEGTLGRGGGHLRSRLVGQVKAAMVQPTPEDPHGAGILVDPEVGPVTDELEVFQRVPQPRLLSAAQQMLVTSIQVGWVSTIDFVERTYR